MSTPTDNLPTTWRVEYRRPGQRSVRMVEATNATDAVVAGGRDLGPGVWRLWSYSDEG